MASRAYTAFEGDVLTTATGSADIGVAAVDSILVIWTVTNAALVGDLGTTTVQTFTPTDDGGPGAILAALMPATSVAAAALTSGVATKVDRYDVRGLEKIRLSLTNAAAATRNLVMHVYLDN